MTDVESRTQARARLPHEIVSALRSAQLYGPVHPTATKNLTTLLRTLERLLSHDDVVVVGVVGAALVVDGHRVDNRADTSDPLWTRLRSAGVERVIFRRGVKHQELATFIESVSTLVNGDADERMSLPRQAHITTDRIRADQRDEQVASEVGAMRRLYASATQAAEDVWESALTEGQPAVGSAVSAVSGLAAIVRENRSALLALTAMKRYDKETFSHMVNVAILTMAQARTLGVDGELLTELGVAALLHDIGKIRTPLEILTKPDALTDAEIGIMRRHVIDGAEILRCTPGMLPLAPIVAFEHHLRANGTGYPPVQRTTLNVGTVLCSIADVYDAMRTKRRYQNTYPNDRILAVLESRDGGDFDAHLVRRFVQLMGMYPPGTLVRLSTREIAVVLKAYAPDPYAPQVRVVRDAAGQAVTAADVRCLWETGGTAGPTTTVETPLDPEDYGIDPMTLLGERSDVCA